MCALETAQEKFGVFLKPTRTLLELRTSQQSHREHRGCPATEPGGRAQTGPNPAPSTLVPCPKVPGGLCCAGGAGHRRSLPPGTEGAPRLPPHCAPSTRSHLGVPKAPQDQEEPRARSGGPCPSTGQNARKAGPYPAEETGSCATNSLQPWRPFSSPQQGGGGTEAPLLPRVAALSVLPVARSHPSRGTTLPAPRPAPGSPQPLPSP